MTPSRERGSAYLVVLFALVILTLLGLSLVLVTQTEMQIGTNERIGNRAFYAADSGVGLATARVLVSADHRSEFYILRDEPRPATTTRTGELVELSPFYPILDAPCALCSINQGSEFLEMNHAVNVQASRIAWDGSGDPDDDEIVLRRNVLGQKNIGVMIDIQPWQPTPEAFQALVVEEDREKIKF
jgi:hypothetical protein